MYAARVGAATNEQVLQRWMEGVGMAFDSKVAQDASRLYRQRQLAAKNTEFGMTAENDIRTCRGDSFP